MMALAEGGFQVGELAKYYHPCCEDIGHCGHHIKALNYHESLGKTAKYIHNENVILYEPAVVFENFFIRIDVFVKRGNEVELIEVKAKSFDRAKGSFRNANGKGDYIDRSWRPYLYDVAFRPGSPSRPFPIGI